MGGRIGHSCPTTDTGGRNAPGRAPRRSPEFRRGRNRFAVRRSTRSALVRAGGERRGAPWCTGGGVRRSSHVRAVGCRRPGSGIEGAHDGTEDALIIQHVAERILKARIDLAAGDVRDAVQTAYDEFRYARVRTYLPVLLERRAGDLLHNDGDSRSRL
ncbi:three-helix bundle dimerization domain-containing protein [Streptomyces sp. NPDC002602]|uniref:three-helix bundle dimerization domain-containing protein n=1 Tax=Streptomyces sp. NPDC002602 TaxID=3364654 RepID=UPI00369002B6